MRENRENARETRTQVNSDYSNIESMVVDDESFNAVNLRRVLVILLFSMYVVLVFRSDGMDTAEVLLTTSVMTAKCRTVQFSDGHVFTLLGECV